MAILAIGHGSGMAVKQCSSSEGDFGQCTAGGLTLLLIRCCFLALLCVCSSSHVDLLDDLAVYLPIL